MKRQNQGKKELKNKEQFKNLASHMIKWSRGPNKHQTNLSIISYFLCLDLEHFRLLAGISLYLHYFWPDGSSLYLVLLLCSLDIPNFC